MNGIEEPSSGPYAVIVRWGVWIALILWAGLAIALAWALYVDATNRAGVAASKDLIGPLLTGSGVLIAVVAFLRDRQKIANDRHDAKSKVYYEQAKLGLEEAYDLLRDQNNDRVIWVRAARLIMNAQKFGSSIRSEEYQEAYKLAEFRIRMDLLEALTLKGESGQQSAMPPAFFFGHKDWRTTKLTLDELAIETSNEVRVHSVSIDSVVPDTITRNLSGRSVIVVMDFLRFPDGFEDPLNQVDNDTYKRWPDSWGPQQGAQRYLEHQRKFTALNKKLIDRRESSSNEADLDAR